MKTILRIENESAEIEVFLDTMGALQTKVSCPLRLLVLDEERGSRPPANWRAPVATIAHKNGRASLSIDGHLFIEDLHSVSNEARCDQCGQPVDPEQQRSIELQLLSARLNTRVRFAACSEACRDAFMASGDDKDLLPVGPTHDAGCMHATDKQVAVVVAHRDGTGAYVPQEVHGFETCQAIGPWWRTPTSMDATLKAPPKTLRLKKART